MSLARQVRRNWLFPALVGLGVFWFLRAPFGDIFTWGLGLELILMAVFIAFTSSMIRWGYTARGVLSVVFPAVACLLLLKVLGGFGPYLVDLSAAMFRKVGLITVAYLYVIFAWIYVFPKPTGVAPPVNPASAPQWKRLEWAGAVIVGALLLYTTMKVVLGVGAGRVAGVLSAIEFKIDVRLLVLSLYLLLLLRVSLHFYSPAPETMIAASGEKLNQ